MVREALGSFIDDEQVPLTPEERRRLIREIVDEVLGLGPLQRLLDDPLVSEIMVNGADRIYVERGGRLHLTGTTFSSDAHLRRVIERIVSRVGRRIDESSPLVDARLQDGSRVNAVIPPLAVDGPSLTIRKFSRGTTDCRGPDQVRLPLPGHGTAATRMRPGTPEHHRLRRYRHGKNHTAQCSLLVYSSRRTHRHY